MDSKFLKYNCLDAACTKEIEEKIWADLSQGYQKAYDLTISLFPVLMFMQTKGIAINESLLEEAKIEILQQRDKKQVELDALCGRPLNCNSSKDCQKYFYGELGYTAYIGKTGNASTDDIALQRLARGTQKQPGLPQAKLVQEIRGLNKLYTTYLSMNFDQDLRLRCSFNPRGTKFGRLSSSKTLYGTGGNMQNLPGEFKKFLVPDPGYVFVEVDKKQAEWVVVAYLTGDANMISVVEQKKDTHIHTASLMFGLSTEIIKYEDTVVGHITDAALIKKIRQEDEKLALIINELPRTLTARQAGKKSNHSLNYDAGANTFALVNELSVPEAKRLVALYKKIYPGIPKWYDSIKKQLQKDRSLVNFFGRKVTFLGAWDEDLWKAAYSMLPQSTVVDSLNIGMVNIYNDSWLTKTINLDILAQVHDSILFQIPEEFLSDKDLFTLIKEKIYSYLSPKITYNNRTFTIDTDMKVGLNWGSFNQTTNPKGMTAAESFEDFSKTLLAWKNLNVKGTS